jgi:archaellum component FlaC
MLVEIMIQYSIEFLLGVITLLIGGIGAVHAGQTKKTQSEVAETRKSLEEHKNSTTGTFIDMMTRMEKNFNTFQGMHSESMTKMSDITNELHHTNATLDNTNRELRDLTGTVSYVIREQIPKLESDIQEMKEDIIEIKVKQEHCPIIKGEKND